MALENSCAIALPLRGVGKGMSKAAPPLRTPTPNPSPQGGGERTVFAETAYAIALRSCGRNAYFAATTMISTRYCGAASLASTVARAGVLPGDTHASQAAFISAKAFMSVM
jgi:hypothetical protein